MHSRSSFPSVIGCIHRSVLPIFREEIAIQERWVKKRRRRGPYLYDASIHPSIHPSIRSVPFRRAVRTPTAREDASRLAAFAHPRVGLHRNETKRPNGRMTRAERSRAASRRSIRLINSSSGAHLDEIFFIVTDDRRRGRRGLLRSSLLRRRHIVRSCACVYVARSIVTNDCGRRAFWTRRRVLLCF